MSHTFKFAARGLAKAFAAERMVKSQAKQKQSVKIKNPVLRFFNVTLSTILEG